MSGSKDDLVKYRLSRAKNTYDDAKKQIMGDGIRQ